MDLSERKTRTAIRHPWETARLEAIQRIIVELGLKQPRVLDIGCGDGYLVGELHRRLRFKHVVAQDPHLTDEMIGELSCPEIDFVREIPDDRERFDVVLLLDVLEHAEPISLLRELTTRRLASGGQIVITVPAFQQLFGSHDRTLKHRRRYSRHELEQEVRDAGLQVLRSGYLFASLLLPRAIAVFVERVVRRGLRSSHGVGAWQGRKLLTNILHTLFALDNRLCMAANAHGVRVPGLSVWMTCKTS